MYVITYPCPNPEVGLANLCYHNWQGILPFIYVSVLYLSWNDVKLFHVMSIVDRYHHSLSWNVSNMDVLQTDTFVKAEMSLTD